MRKPKTAMMILLSIIMVIALSGCESGTSSEYEISSLVGNWEPEELGESYQAGYITEDTIEIFWFSDDGETVSLYWSGTYENPEEAVTSYSWDSVNDTSKTDSALLASGDDTKTFTYEDGILSYSVTALGVTTTYELVMTDTDYSVYGDVVSDEDETEEEAQSETEAENYLETYDLFTYDELNTLEYTQQDFCIDVIIEILSVEYDSDNDEYSGSYNLWYETGDTFTCDVVISSAFGVASDDYRYTILSSETGAIARYASTTYNDGSFGMSDLVAIEIIDFIDIETVYDSVRNNYSDIGTLYENVQRNPDNYNNSYEYADCYAVGTIKKVITDTGDAEYVLDTSSGYVYVYWYEDLDERGFNLLEGDNVTVYGCVTGLEQDDINTIYTGGVSVPRMMAYFIDLN